MITQKDDATQSLASLISAFNTTIESLKKSYALLKKKVASLDKELEEKNELLEKKVGELDHTKEHLRNILLSMPSGVFVTDTEGKVILMNESASIMLQYSIQELNDGKADSQITALLEKTLSERKSFHIRERLLKASDGSQLFVESKTSPIQSAHGDIIGAVEVFNDLGPLKKLEEFAMQRDRLSALGEMAANVAHEIRNPINGIQGFAKLLRRDCEGDETKVKLVDKIISGSENLNRLVTTLLEYTRPVRLQRQKIDINTVVKEVYTYICEGLKKQEKCIDVRLDLDTDLSLVDVDTAAMKQVFMNLFLNAAAAVASVKNPCIIARTTQHRDGVCIRIADNGTGIEKNVRSKIFEPFYSTKADGTGLGLPICRKIIASHEGILRFMSSRGKGTIFTVIMPRSL